MAIWPLATHPICLQGIQKETQFPLLNSMSKTDTVEKLACLLTGEAIMMSGPI